MYKKNISFLLTAVFFGAVFFQAAQIFGQTCTPPPSGMVAWYPGDGNARDISPGNNNGGNQGTQTAFTTGKVAQAFQFNGNQASHITVPDSPSLRPTTALTIDAWINPAPGQSDLASFVFKGNVNTLAAQPYSLFLRDTNKLDFRIGNETTADALDSISVIPANTYTHVAATYDGTTMRIYINGVLDASKTTTIGTLNQTNRDSLIIGSFVSLNTNYVGAVDELEIFNRTLSQTEIQAVFNAGSAGKCKPVLPPATGLCALPPSNMVAWLAGDGNANDISRNGNNGTPASQTAFAAGKVVQAFQFNGSSQSVVIVPDSPSLHATNALTIDAWVNPTNASGDILYKGCFGSGNCQPYGILLNGFTATTAQPVFSIGSDTTFDRVSSGSPIPLNAYTHIAATYDGTTMRVYINGVLDISKPVSIGTLNQTNTLPLNIGQGPDGVFTGAVDEVEIFNRVLSDSEIYNIYNAGNSGKCKSRTNARVDFDGDGRTDLGVFRPSNGTWYLNRSTSSFYGVQFGVSTDRLAPADYDGDGKSDIAVWREGSFAYFYILQSSNNTFRFEQFGQTGDSPIVVGDWDGDGKADPAVYRAATTAGGQSFFYYRPSAQPGADFNTIYWGTNGDEAVRGDFDGDGKLDAAVYRASDGNWYIRRSSDGVLRAQQWGLSTDKRVSGDFDGDGKTDFAVFRPSSGVWYILQSSDNQSRTQQLGLASDQIVPADYDGDGKTDFAVFRPSNGTWYILNSSTGNAQNLQFGQNGDTAAPTAYLQ